jgi:hypothetical protein
MKNASWLKKNFNKFWETTANNWLIPLLSKVYRDEKRLRSIKKWVKDGKKVIMLEITDFYMDPFFIVLHGDGFELGTEKEEPDIIVKGNKTRLIIDGPVFYRLILSYLTGDLEIRFRKFSVRDMLMFVKIFYIWGR